jgi:2-amino-4-hydroxy-6-hydroxymethyldihydropteridine diphosphokinase
MSNSTVAFISLGSNMGDRIMFIRDARNFILSDIGIILIESKIYETAAWGNTNQPNFLNQVLKIQTNLSPKQLLEACLEIEKKLGRTRVKIWDQRTIDLDILFYNKHIIQYKNLTIPHPYMHLRNFILVPMNEIAPEFIHPVLEFSMSQLLEKCPDTLETSVFLD